MRSLVEYYQRSLETMSNIMVHNPPIFTSSNHVVEYLNEGEDISGSQKERITAGI